MRSAAAVLVLSWVLVPFSWGANVMLDRLSQGELVRGFRTEAAYLDDAGQAMGARFIHARTGFTVDLLQIESLPQTFTWVNTSPVSDQGEPHTQEHLLLGKGTTGRAFSALDDMWLVDSSAFTRQRETAYHFNTAAGTDVFFQLLERQLHALLHPNYTDEEIRREVRNFDVAKGPDGTLRLEEKGTVYNEMVSSSSSAMWPIYRTSGHLVYGDAHPLSYSAGGAPEGIRTMKPEHIRTFHREHYFLANIGTIAALPRTVTVEDALGRIDAALQRVEPETRGRAPQPAPPLPAAKAAPGGTIAHAEYPHRNENQPSPVRLAWPAERTLPLDEFMLMELFLSTMGGDPTTNLYKIFVDSRTRKITTGAQGVYAGASWDGGQSVVVHLQDVAPENFNDARLGEIRKLVMDELERVAAFADGSPELAELHERLAANLLRDRRGAVKFVDSPPGFGLRETGADWLQHLQQLSTTPGFRKSVTLKPQLEWIEKEIATTKNIWRERLAKWKLTGVTPYVVASRPQPKLLDQRTAEQAERIKAETARLLKHYGVDDEQEAIRRYQTEYDAATAKIEEAARTVSSVPLAASLPMHHDEPLRFEARTLDGEIPFVVSRFENMTSGTLGLALRLDGVPRTQLRYVALLPALLTRVGVIENGRPVPYEEMTQRLRREILSLNASLSTNARRQRVELVVRGSGMGPEEMKRALNWMSLVLQTPDWRPENLPRIRDLVEQSLGGWRQTMQGREEDWADSLPVTYWRQRNPLLVATTSFLTSAHDALRVKWLLKDAEGEDGKAVAALLTELSTAARGTTREALKAKLAAPETLEKLSPSARTLAADALKDLDLALIDVPDGSLAADWEYLCTAVRDDLQTPAADALDAFDEIRRVILKSGGARLFFAGSPALEKQIAPDLEALLAGLERAPLVHATHGDTPLVQARLRERDPSATNPVHVGLSTTAKPGGVVMTSVPAAHLADHADNEKVLDLLATNVYSGYGAHGIFLKTINAGLAYSNGVRASANSGRLNYRAERTPDLAQTVRFVVGELKKAPPEAGIGDYVVAQVFGSRAASSYEGRAEAMAADLADAQPPELVRAFRQAVLDLRKQPDFERRLLARKDAAYAPVLPGLGAKTTEVPDGVYLVVAPDKQLESWQAYLQEVEGPETRLHRLYGRDFWMP